MLFNSYIFILVFLPITLCVYYLIGRAKSRLLTKVMLLLASYMFIAYYDVFNLLILLLSTTVNYFCNRIIRTRPAMAKVAMSAGILFNIAFLGYYKYIGFFSEFVNRVFETDIGIINNIMPIGISFYSFLQVVYLVDNYRKEVPDYGIIDYFLYTGFFSKIVQGPIAYHNELLPQFNIEEKQNFNADNFATGMMLFAVGLSKKVFLADRFGKLVDYGFGNISSINTSVEALLVIVGYSLQLYFDFSGYCDMAVGVGKMMNIDLPINFNSPYKARNITDFWKRWHITLTRILTKYIYIPLGGNRKGKWRTYINIMIVFLISGFWHGTGVHFILWGAIHGIGTVLYRITKKSYDRIPKLIQWIVTFVFVNLAWVFFRAETVGDAVSLIARLFAGGVGISSEIGYTFSQSALFLVALHLIPVNCLITVFFICALLIVTVLNNSNEMCTCFVPNSKSWILVYTLLMLSILSISGVSTFLYSNF